MDIMFLEINLVVHITSLKFFYTNTKTQHLRIYHRKYKDVFLNIV